ncbi:MAG: hypothetical protein AAF346_01420 [Pseudomonadota bacterium]
MSSSGPKAISAAAVAALVLIAVIATIEATALLALLASAFIVVICARLVVGCQQWWRGVQALIVVQVVTVAIYLAHYLVLPNVLGFTGPGALGTDDNFFYSQIAPHVPHDFPLRDDYFGVIYDFSKAHRLVLSVFIALFGTFHPLQVLIFNATGLALASVFVAALTQRLGFDERQQRLAFWLMLLCPFCLANGAVLLREGWLAACFAMTLFGCVRRQVLPLFIALAIAYVMRFESAVLLTGNVGLMLFFMVNSRLEETPSGPVYRLYFQAGRVAIQFAVVLLLIGVIVAVGPTLLPLIGKAALGRPEFVETFIRSVSEREGGTSTLYTISTLPLYASLPLGLLFFAGAPFLALNLIVIDGTFIPRYLLQNIFALEMIILMPYFLRGCLHALKERNALYVGLLAVFVVDTLLLSQFSLQIRHKVMIMPAFYLLCVIGTLYPDNRVARLTLLPAVFLILLSGTIMLSNLDVI